MEHDIDAKIKIADWIDATTGRLIKIRPINCLHPSPRDPYNCIGKRAIMYRDSAVYDARVSLEYTWIWYKKDDKPTKYKNSAHMRRWAELNDLETRKELLNEIKAEFNLFGKKNGEHYVEVQLFAIPHHQTREYL
jgi:hypothetical protein